MTALPTLVILSPPTLNPSAVDVNVVVFAPLPMVAVVAVTAVNVGASFIATVTVVLPEASWATVVFKFVEETAPVALPPAITNSLPNLWVC